MTVDQLFERLRRHGHEPYGEDVTLLEHSLQCAQILLDDDAPTSLVIAGLFHDIGHTLAPTFSVHHNDEHDRQGAQWIDQVWGPIVSRPIALHVAAKRFLCVRESGYFAALSMASQLSLAHQGGPMTELEARAFLTKEGADDAVWLRRADDAAKVMGASTLPLDDYYALAIQLTPSS